MRGRSSQRRASEADPAPPPPLPHLSQCLTPPWPLRDGAGVVRVDEIDCLLCVEVGVMVLVGVVVRVMVLVGVIVRVAVCDGVPLGDGVCDGVPVCDGVTVGSGVLPASGIDRNARLGGSV